MSSRVGCHPSLQQDPPLVSEPWVRRRCAWRASACWQLTLGLQGGVRALSRVRAPLANPSLSAPGLCRAPAAASQGSWAESRLCAALALPLVPETFPWALPSWPTLPRTGLRSHILIWEGKWIILHSLTISSAFSRDIGFLCHKQRFLWADPPHTFLWAVCLWSLDVLGCLPPYSVTWPTGAVSARSPGWRPPSALLFLLGPSGGPLEGRTQRAGLWVCPRQLGVRAGQSLGVLVEDLVAP